MHSLLDRTLPEWDEEKNSCWERPALRFYGHHSVIHLLVTRADGFDQAEGKFLLRLWFVRL